MQEPVLTKAPLSGFERESQLSPREPLRPDGTPHHVLVGFYRRMRRQRVYPLTVALHKLPSESPTGNRSTAPVLVRPFIPGAQVTPAEQELKSLQLGEQAIFYVTPSARGWLAGARLQVCQQGLLLQEIPLPMKTAGSLLTWLLAALTVLVPAVVIGLTKFVNLSSSGPYGAPPPISRGTRAAPRMEREQPPPAAQPPEQRPDVLPPGAQPQVIPAVGVVLALAPQERDGQPKADDKNPPQAEGAPPNERAQPKEAGRGHIPPAGEDQAKPPAVQPKPGDGRGLEAQIDELEVPAAGGASLSLGRPSLNGPVAQCLMRLLPAIEVGTVHLTGSLALSVQHTYDLLYNENFSFDLGVFLLGLTLISWIGHRPSRASRRGPLVLLAPGVGTALVVEALPATWRPEPPGAGQKHL